MISPGNLLIDDISYKVIGFQAPNNRGLAIPLEDTAFLPSVYLCKQYKMGYRYPCEVEDCVSMGITEVFSSMPILNSQWALNSIRLSVED